MGTFQLLLKGYKFFDCLELNLNRTTPSRDIRLYEHLQGLVTFSPLAERSEFELFKQLMIGLLQPGFEHQILRIREERLNRLCHLRVGLL